MARSRTIPAALIALQVIGAVGLIALVAIAPGMGIVVKRFGYRKKRVDARYTSHVLSRLNRKGYIEYEGEGKDRRVRITKAGRTYLEKQRFQLVNRPQRRRWDGYWRIVMFDIPESQRSRRDALRRELVEAGFKKLQWSVWVSPDECEGYIKLLKADQHIGKRLVYLKTKDIEYGSTLRKHFKIIR